MSGAQQGEVKTAATACSGDVNEMKTKKKMTEAPLFPFIHVCMCMMVHTMAKLPAFFGRPLPWTPVDRVKVKSQSQESSVNDYILITLTSKLRALLGDCIDVAHLEACLKSDKCVSHSLLRAAAPALIHSLGPVLFILKRRALST